VTTKSKRANFWRTWDEPDRQIAVAQWEARDICVVFPLPWATEHKQVAMIGRAKERIREIEGKSHRTLAPGSVLLAFSEHEDQPQDVQLLPDTPRALLPPISAPLS
jgi:hypothetical protein